MTKSGRYFLLLLVPALMMVACKKDSTPSWDVDLQLPLLKTSLTMDKLLPDSLLMVGTDNSLTLVYKNPVYVFNFDSLFTVPDTISHKYYPAFPGIQILPGQTIYDQTEQESFDFNDAEVSRIVLERGFITVDFVNTLNENIDLSYKILSATRNGQAFQVSETVPPQTHFNKRYDVSGYTLDLTGPSQLSSNKLLVASKAGLAANASAVTLTAQDEFDMSVTFEEVSVAYARGYFAHQHFSFGPEETAVSIFKNILEGTIDLASVKMKFVIENGFGLDARVRFSDITAINSNTNNSVSLSSPVIGQTINIARALETGDPTHPLTPSRYEFDLSTSNIQDLIENLPDRLRYAVEVESNPLGNVSSGNDYYYRGHYLNAYLDMEIPLSLMAGNLTLGDTTEFSMGEPDADRPIRHGTLLLLADNGFPLDAELILYTLDAQGQVLDVLIDHEHLMEAPLDADGIAKGAVRTQISIPLSEERIDRLYQASKIYVTAVFNTAGTDYIRLYDTYKLDLKVTGAFNYVVE